MGTRKAISNNQYILIGIAIIAIALVIFNVFSYGGLGEVSNLHEQFWDLQMQIERLQAKVETRPTLDFHTETVQRCHEQLKTCETTKGCAKHAVETPKERKKRKGSPGSPGIGDIDFFNKAVDTRIVDARELAARASDKFGLGSFKWPFEMNGRQCHLHLGECFRVGCDGAVWLSTLFCDDGWAQKCAVKFHKDKNEVFTNETAVAVFFEDILDDWDQLFQLMTATMAYVNVPLKALKASTGECEIMDIEAGRKCHRLYSHAFDGDMGIPVRGFVMPRIHDGWCNLAYTNVAVRQQALKIVYDLTSIFSKMASVNVLHCDMNWAHISISQNEHDLGIVPRLFDFSRMKKCHRKNIDCINGFRAQSYQYASLIVDLCTKTKKCFGTGSMHYVHSMGPCKKSEMGDTEEWMQKMTDEIDREDNRKRIQEDWVCPHKQVLVNVVNTVWDWTWNREEPDWRSISKKLKKALEKTDF